MFSEIGNKGLMRTVGKALKVLDPRQAPSQLETDSVKVVAPLDLGSSVCEGWQLSEGSISLGGLVGGSWYIVGDNPAASLFPDVNLPSDPNYDVLITSIAVWIKYTIGGIGVDVNRVISLSFLVKAAGTTIAYVDAGTLLPWFIVRNNRTWYNWVFPYWRDWDSIGGVGAVITSNVVSNFGKGIFVQGGGNFGLLVGRDAGGTFPADTIMSVSAQGLRVPKGCRFPI